MSWIKVIFLNIFVTFSLLGMLLLAPPFVYYLYSITLKQRVSQLAIDSKAHLNIYSDISWAESHFSEFSKLDTTYYDFITWRRDDFAGETINISNGVRATTVPQMRNNNISDYYFLGGSTTWGFGVNDANTYPSLFAQRIKTQAHNFGEASYIARQSLAILNNFLLENSISDLSGRHIVFYDGVNDVSERCRSEILGLGTGEEHKIQNSLSFNSYEKKYSYGRLFQQLTEFLQAVTRKLGIQSSMPVASNTYSCSSNSDRAEEVARTLVETWKIASDLVTQRGGNFTAILQPVAFVGNPNISYLDLTSSNDLALGMQYKAVYPIIRQFAEARNISFVDLSLVYDNCNDCYIDFCHVGPQGHQILVESLVHKLGR